MTKQEILNALNEQGIEADVAGPKKGRGLMVSGHGYMTLQQAAALIGGKYTGEGRPKREKRQQIITSDYMAMMQFSGAMRRKTA